MVMLNLFAIKYQYRAICHLNVEAIFFAIW